MSMLEPVFKHMSPQHRLHVAHFVAEVFGRTEIIQRIRRQPFPDDTKTSVQTPDRRITANAGWNCCCETADELEFA